MKLQPAAHQQLSSLPINSTSHLFKLYKNQRVYFTGDYVPDSILAEHSNFLH